MKSVVFVLLALFSNALLHAQNAITQDYCTSFVHQKVNNLNIQLYNAIAQGEIRAYRSDSLVTEWKFQDLEEYLSPTFEVITPNPENPDDPYDLVGKEVKRVFTPESDFLGVGISYQKEVEDHEISFKSSAVAMLVNIGTETGINFGPYPVFWVKIKDLKKVLSKADVRFYTSLFSLRSVLGDFLNIYLDANASANHLGNEISAKTIYNETYFQRIDSKMDTALGVHLSELLKYAATKQLEAKKPFYKDAELKSVFDSLALDLSQSVMVLVPNPNNPDDPYDFIEVKVYEYFDFFQVNEIISKPVKKDFIIQMNTMHDSAQKSVFISYNQIRKFIPLYDRIVLEELLNSFSN